MKSKENLRRTLLAKLACVSPQEIEEKSALIVERLLASGSITGSDVLITFCGRNTEVNTLPLIQQTLEQGKKVIVPLTREHGRLEWSRLDDIGQLRPGPFGIPEPIAEKIHLCNPPLHAPILVPCLGFTSTGDRLGFGGGYFDRYLAHHAGPKMGLAFELQHVDHLPTEPHDVSMDKIITELGQYPPRPHK